MVLPKIFSASASSNLWPPTWISAINIFSARLPINTYPQSYKARSIFTSSRRLDDDDCLRQISEAPFGNAHKSKWSEAACVCANQHRIPTLRGRCSGRHPSIPADAVPDRIVGTSAGAVVGAPYAAGNDGFELHKLAIQMEEGQVGDWSLPDRGVIRGEALQNFINHAIGQRPLGVPCAWPSRSKSYWRASG